MQETPQSMRLAITVFGKTNSGKSALINAICGQKVSLVSAKSGTTTDPVKKAMELYPVGACLFTDTAGFDDRTELGALRTARTRELIDRTDLALFVTDHAPLSETEQAWLSALAERKIPTVGVLNKAELLAEPLATAEELKKQGKIPFVCVSAKNGSGLEALKASIVETAPRDFELPSIVGHLVGRGDTVLLVMPQDTAAPKGRLILPQVQVTRDLLDIGATIVSVTAEQMESALAALRKPPKLIITDSQVFPFVFERKPTESALTSFSVLLARYKGDIESFTEGAKAVDFLREGDRVLIAEACTHKPLDGDIGRVKIPTLLRKKVGEGLHIEVVGGNDFPEDLSPYRLIVHCGGCMMNRRYLLNRIRAAKEQGIPITNYGILLAKLSGILEKIER